MESVLQETSLLVTGAVLVYVLTIFAVAQAVRDNSIVDIAWGPGFALIAVTSYGANAAIMGRFDSLGRPNLVLTLVLLWAFRLAAYLTIRKNGHGEDWRYQKMRAAWGARAAERALVQVFLLQGALMLLVSAPVVTMMSSLHRPLTLFDCVGAAIALGGLGFESVADWQLLRFKRKPEHAGAVMQDGLWRYSRHPNYFGEAVFWWGIWLIALVAGHPWTVFGPMLITFLLLRVSGVPMLERRYREDEAYQAYVQRTSRFVPRPPKPSAVDH